MKIFYTVISIMMLIATFGMKKPEDKKLCFAGFVVATISALLFQFLPYFIK